VFKRAWLVIAALWAALLLAIAGMSSDFTMSWGFLVIALGPLCVPMLLRLFFGYVIFGGASSKAPSRFQP
jgi:hypothetical protein